MSARFFTVLILIFCLGQRESFAQVGKTGLDWIENALENNQVSKADSAFKAQLKLAAAEGMVDSIPLYVSYMGRIAGEKGGDAKGIEAVNRFVDEFLEKGLAPNLNKQAFREAAGYFEYIGATALAYEANIKAFDWASKDPQTSFKERGRIQNNLASYSLYLGKRAQAKEHSFKAIALYRKEPKLDPESMYLSYNALGNINWFGSRFDSAEYYFSEALKQFPEMEATPRNQHYRPAMVLNNLAGVQAVLGKTSAGIQSMETTIRHLSDFIEAMSDPLEIAKGQEFLYQAIDNLAGMHKGLGNYSKARELLEYSYEQKKSTFGPESAEVFKSQILLGQIYFALREYEQAELLLRQGLGLMDQFEGDYIDWKADAFGTLARLEESRGNTDSAKNWYLKADAEYQKILGGDYDFIYLDFLTSASTFFAAAGLKKEALNAAEKGLKYVRANQGAGTLLDFNHQINLAEVHFLLKSYSESLRMSRTALETFKEDFLRGERSWLDSIQIETQKPKAILIQVKSSYFLATQRDQAFLEKSIAMLDEAIDAVERRKTVLQSDQDMGLLIADNQELYDFAKKLDLELFEITGEKRYMESLLSRHESSVFNRLRSRLQRFDNLRFANVPSDIQETELQLKTDLAQSLQMDGEGFESYLIANSAWEGFLETLKTKFPDYYQFRYGNLEASLDDIQKTIPAGTSLIRYLFVGNDLTAIVMDADSRDLVKLDYGKVANHIATLTENWNQPQVCLAILNQLYTHLWQPILPKVRHEKVIIIPDGDLYNLSFELLTPTRLNDYNEFANGCLLSKHSISYHFHSHLLKSGRSPQSYQSNYVAFAPGFSDQMKIDYLSRVRDSLYLDRAYLTLVPQPFTQELVSRMKRLLGGKTFTETQSTIQNFIGSAGDNRILHIGTHAESNNLSPDFSKLIFSKSGDPASLEGSNELFAFDIYKLNLRAQMAVLTACETGKSTVAPGEGMLSLAHAFTYAGSQSLLVGLWKIDEKASSQITETFYQKLAEGMDKASALRAAKLQYLGHASGRALSPEFWAGIVLIGDTSPIALETNIPWWKYTLLALAILAFAGLIWKKRKVWYRNGKFSTVNV
jgi:CHAT domain-containing protein